MPIHFPELFGGYVEFALSIRNIVNDGTVQLKLRLVRILLHDQSITRDIGRAKLIF